ncbi:hypothetical protein RKE38_16980 [Phycicoccus sp. M110.8]|uniref:hypothetical protein n=1 Tax=Phycicoccus sp. M110.8 TaxID=3075433 RepID=UPI0028FD8A0F|nr:hypothetical protein [Phycicoccus sp. M110.8]MDU0315395.1 hypothetical protein [Phycicoccus sp. M110.8]
MEVLVVVEPVHCAPAEERVRHDTRGGTVAAHAVGVGEEPHPFGPAQEQGRRPHAPQRDGVWVVPAVAPARPGSEVVAVEEE